MNIWNELEDQFKEEVTAYGGGSSGFLKRCLELFFNLNNDQLEEATDQLVDAEGEKNRGIMSYFFNEEEGKAVFSSGVYPSGALSKEGLIGLSSPLDAFTKQMKNQYSDHGKITFVGNNARLKQIADDYVTSIIKDDGEVEKNFFCFTSIDFSGLSQTINFYDKESILKKYKDYLDVLEEEKEFEASLRLSAQESKNSNDTVNAPTEILNNEAPRQDQDTKQPKSENLSDDGLVSLVLSGQLNKKKEPEVFSITCAHPNQKYKTGYIFTTTKSANNVDKTVLIATISADQLIKMKEKVGTTLFERNVRDFLGPKEMVNRKIIDTAINNPSAFLAYNNGVNITCNLIEGLDQTGYPLSVNLVNPQVINGAQTVGSLCYAYDEEKKKAQKDGVFDEEELLKKYKKIFVLCKIIESTKDEKSNFATNMTKYSNSQNKILDWDMFANDDIHEIIAKNFKRFNVYYTARRSLKMGKAALKKNGFSDQATIEALAEIHFKQKNILKKASKKDIFKFVEDADGGLGSSLYRKIFHGSNYSEKDKTAKDLFTSYILHKIASNFLMSVSKIKNNGYFEEGNMNNLSETKNTKLVLASALDLYSPEKSFTSEEDRLARELEVLKSIENLPEVDAKFFSYFLRYLLEKIEVSDATKNTALLPQEDLMAVFNYPKSLDVVKGKVEDILTKKYKNMDKSLLECAVSIMHEHVKDIKNRVEKNEALSKKEGVQKILDSLNNFVEKNNRMQSRLRNET